MALPNVDRLSHAGPHALFLRVKIVQRHTSRPGHAGAGRLHVHTSLHKTGAVLARRSSIVSSPSECLAVHDLATADHNFIPRAVSCTNPQPHLVVKMASEVRAEQDTRLQPCNPPQFAQSAEAASLPLCSACNLVIELVWVLCGLSFRDYIPSAGTTRSTWGSSAPAVK